MPTSLVYISKALLRLPQQNREIDDIAATARARHAALGITGALIFTGQHFAQVLEGSAAAIAELMEEIRRDHHHTRIEVVRVAELVHRRFADWTVAYSGPSRYVDRHVAPLFDPPAEDAERSAAIDALVHLMQQFVAHGGVESA